MTAVVSGPGEGERVGRHLLLKLARPELCVSEATVPRDFEGASPHFHEHHVDSFHVLEGELELTVGTETVLAGAGTTVAVPPRIVHAFRASGSMDTTRYLNLHGPDGGFAEYLRRRAAGDESASFDSIDVDRPSGPAEAVVTEPGGGERHDKHVLVITVLGAWPELSFFEFDVTPFWSGVGTHVHDDQVDSFFVLQGELHLELEGAPITASPGTLVAIPPGTSHGIRSAPAPVRFLNFHAPDAGFVEVVRSE